MPVIMEHGLLGKHKLNFPCKVAYYKSKILNEGPKKECEKLGYSSGTEKYNECVETLNEK